MFVPHLVKQFTLEWKWRNSSLPTEYQAMNQPLPFIRVPLNDIPKWQNWIKIDELMIEDQSFKKKSIEFSETINDIIIVENDFTTAGQTANNLTNLLEIVVPTVDVSQINTSHLQQTADERLLYNHVSLTKMRLMAVVYHKEFPRRHWTVAIRYQKNNSWFYCDDHKVSQIETISSFKKSEIVWLVYAKKMSNESELLAFPGKKSKPDPIQTRNVEITAKVNQVSNLTGNDVFLVDKQIYHSYLLSLPFIADPSVLAFEFHSLINHFALISKELQNVVFSKLADYNNVPTRIPIDGKNFMDFQILIRSWIVGQDENESDEADDERGNPGDPIFIHTDDRDMDEID